MFDFDYVYVNCLKKGMLINYTTVKNKDAENFLILDTGEKFFEYYWAKVLNSEGKIMEITFPVNLDGSVPQVRVFPAEKMT